jgi:hypothetical protein
MMSRSVLSVRRANSDFDRKGHLASVYSLQGTDCRDGNVLKDLLIRSLRHVLVIWATETLLTELTTIIQCIGALCKKFVVNLKDKSSVEKNYLCKSDFLRLLDKTLAKSDKYCSKGQIFSH